MLSDRQLMRGILWILPLMFSFLRPYPLIDVAGWIAHGEYFLRHHEILRSDVFSVLATKPLVYPAWAISIFYAAVVRACGLLWLCVLHTLALAVVLWIVYRESIYRLSGPWSRAALLAIAVSWLGSSPLWLPRPSEVALIPFCLAFIWISRIRSLGELRGSFLLKLALLNIAWVNLHGSFVLLTLMLAWKMTFLILEEWTQGRRDVEIFVRPTLILLMLLASSLVNPFFYHVFPYVFETVLASRQRLIEEWGATTFFAHPPIGALFYVCVAGTLFAMIRRRRDRSFWGWMSSPFFLLMIQGFSGIRNAALVFVILLPALFDLGLLGESQSQRMDWNQPRRANVLKLVPFLFAFFVALPFVRSKATGYEPFGEDAVSGMVDYIRASGKTCPVFNDWNVGSYLMLTLPNKIYMDSRNIIYRDEDVAEFERVSAGSPGGQVFFDRFGACFAILRSNTTLGPSWRKIMKEKGFLLFERVD